MNGVRRYWKGQSSVAGVGAGPPSLSIGVTVSPGGWPLGSAATSGPSASVACE